MPSIGTAPVLGSILPDFLLVHRVAAVGDKSALAELHARHGMTLYALAYSIVFDGEAADAAVTAAFREVWRSSASFDPRERTVARWLAQLVRRTARDCFGVSSRPLRRSA